MNKYLRSSNIELLRIFAMFCIVLHHIMVNDVNLLGYNEEVPYSIARFTGGGKFVIFPIINTVAVSGVDLFLMITGFFGVKKFIGKFISLAILCVLTGILMLPVGWLSPIFEPSLKNWFLTATSLHSWFIKLYLVLLLVSPFLEYVFVKLSNNRVIVFWAAATILNIVCCYYLEITNSNGYSLANFIYMYITGRMVRAVKENGYLSPKFSKYAFVVAILVALCVGLTYDWMNKDVQIVDSVKFWAYNSPWTIAIAIMIFVSFDNLKIQSQRINIIASCTLIVYLCHSNLVISYFRNVLTGYMADYLGMMLGLVTVAVIVYFIGTLLGLMVTWGQCRIVSNVRRIGWVNSLFEYIPFFVKK